MGLKLTRICLFSSCIMILANVHQVSSLRCQTEQTSDRLKYNTCPGPQDPPNAIYCCTNKLTYFCCSVPLSGNADISGRPIGLGEDSNFAEIEDGEIVPDLSDSIVEQRRGFFFFLIPSDMSDLPIVIVFYIAIINMCAFIYCCSKYSQSKKRNQQQQQQHDQTQQHEQLSEMIF